MGKILRQVLKCLMFYLYTKRGGKRGIIYICVLTLQKMLSNATENSYCCGLGIVVSNLVLTQKKHTLLSLSCPAPAGATKNKDHRLGLEQFTENSSEIWRWTVIATILITKGVRRGIFWFPQKNHTIDSGSFHFLNGRNPFSLSSGNDKRWYRITYVS